MLAAAIISGVLVAGGLLMGKYYGKPPKDEDTDTKDK